MSYMKNLVRPEILAPAGSVACMRAAINAGADAVYMGGTMFGARAYADNPDETEMLRAIDEIHRNNKKLYLTVNTLLKQTEIEQQLYQYLLPYYCQGVDAVIVQDVGVLHFLHRVFPKLSIHLSTQMTLTQADGVRFFQDMGVTRVVPARELSLSEIRQMKEMSGVEVEIFVHGALCYSYSGQCLMSSMIGGRSGNRGRCAGTCRMQYALADNADGDFTDVQGYLLSTKDLCTIRELPEIISCGVDSLKIEGRMKGAEYVAGVTSAYKRAVEDAMEGKQTDTQKQMFLLKDIYNRGGFTEGYLSQYNGRGMMSMERPNHDGVQVGTISSVKGISAGISLTEPVSAQDVLEIRSGDASYEFTVGREAAEGAKETKVLFTNFKKDFHAAKGQAVYRTKNESLRKELSVKYSTERTVCPVEGSFTAKCGEPMTLSVTGNRITVTVSGDMVMHAKNQAADEQSVLKQLQKTGESVFAFSSLNIHLEENCFLPVGKLNALRRSAFTSLEEAIVKQYRRTAVIHPGDEPDGKRNVMSDERSCPEIEDAGAEPLVSCSASTAGQVRALCTLSYVDEIILQMPELSVKEQVLMAQQCKKANKTVILQLPELFREKTKSLYEADSMYLSDSAIDGFLIKNYEEAVFLKEQGLLKSKSVRADYNLYTGNKEAVAFFLEKGITEITLPVEYRLEELLEINATQADLPVYGRMVLMVSTQCLADNTKGCDKSGSYLYLRDGHQEVFPVRRVCRLCYNLIYNSKRFSIFGFEDEVKRLHPKRVRLSFTTENEIQTKQVMEEFHEIFQLHGKQKTSQEDVTRGHFHRGIL